MMSALEMFKVGIGPSSSHTLGPMKAGKMFADELSVLQHLFDTTRIQVDLYGSLSLTGKGHQTDQAILLGLSGEEPETVAVENIPTFIGQVKEQKRLSIGKEKHSILFHFDADMIFHSTRLPLHENGLKISAFSGDHLLLERVYYSIGGGVVVEEKNFGKADTLSHIFPFPFATAKELLEHCQQQKSYLSSLVLENELSLREKSKIVAYCRHIWGVMQTCMERGKMTAGVLPGPLKVARRAPALYAKLSTSSFLSQNILWTMDWVNMCALAVSEENAAGGRVVTAPTNGACGIIPAVLAFYDQFIEPIDDEVLLRFFLASGAVGLLYRMNASISGAEVGCQGEVGVACSMAAAGLAELLGASPVQVCTAAEIGMEHNLGLTCDPVGGQVQIPCIERNAINAIKAINAARMAMERLSAPTVPLDKVIEAMFQTGKDMNAKYRETALGGLAGVGIIGCS